MTNDETILFIRFLQNKGMQQNFTWFYQNHRFDKRTIEEFLEQTEAEDAILSAFDLAGAPNTIFSPKYWTEFNTKWMKKLKEYREAGEKQDLSMQTVQCGHCGRQLPRSAFAITTKGQLHKFCRECESGEWDRKRKAEEAAAKEREERERLQKEIAEKHREENEQILNEIAEKEEKPEVKAAPKLGEHEVTIHYKPEVKKLVFNAVLSAYIYTKGLTKCYLEAKRDGRMFLIFNNDEGANVTWLITKTSRLAQVCSTAHCRQIAEYFHLTLGELYYLHVTKNLSKTEDVINVEILQVHTREEYAGIAARREEAQKAGRPVPGEDVPEYEEAAASPPEGRKNNGSGDTKVPDHSVSSDDAPLLDFTESKPEPEQPKPAPKKPNVVITSGATKSSGTSVLPNPLKSPFGAAVRSMIAKDPGQSLMIPLSNRDPAELLQQLIDRNHITEHDIASFLYNKGWKLQEPVVVTTHKKFKV